MRLTELQMVGTREYLDLLFIFRQYFVIVFKEKPFELWDLRSGTLLREMPRNFPHVTALVRLNDSRLIHHKTASSFDQSMISTVPTFNSCTKRVGSWEKIYNQMPDCHPFSVTYAWMTLQLNVALISKLHGSLMCLDYFLTC